MNKAYKSRAEMRKNPRLAKAQQRVISIQRRIYKNTTIILKLKEEIQRLEKRRDENHDEIETVWIEYWGFQRGQHIQFTEVYLKHAAYHGVDVENVYRVVGANETGIYVMGVFIGQAFRIVYTTQPMHFPLIFNLLNEHVIVKE